MTDALQDVRYAFRTLSRAPGFATAAVLTLALGIGANTAIFTALDHLILRSLPVEHPEQLVNVVTSRPNGINYNLSYPWFAALRDDNAVFSGVLAHSPSPVTLTSGSAAERLEAGAISAGFFRTLALPLTLGRDFTTDEDQPGAARDVVVLGYGFWRRRFNADSGVLGRTIGLNGRPFTVVGVAARGFSGLTRGIEEQAWTPITLAGRTVTPDFATRTRISWLNVVARLTADHTPERATEILTAFDQHQVELGQRDTTEHTKLLPAARGLTWAVSEYKEPLGILVALLASWLPARRAARVDPMVALRSE